jgi:hypothetical protein
LTLIFISYISNNKGKKGGFIMTMKKTKEELTSLFNMYYEIETLKKNLLLREKIYF